MISTVTENNYLYIPEFISSDRALQLANTFVNFCQATDLPGDNQAENSHSAYNYIEFLELLCEKTPEVSKFLGETVLPTYSYARVYREDSILLPHKDRDACEISLTLQLAGDAEWPIYIKKQNGDTVSLNLKSGDAMLYLGCEAEHWREQFKGNRYVQVFLHYVRSRGDKNYAFFDKNKDDERSLLTNDRLVKQEITEPITPSKNEIKENIEDYIVVFDDLISNDLCDAILTEYQNSDDWNPTFIGDGVINRNIRNTDAINLSVESIIDRNFEIRKAIDSELFKVAALAINEYNKLFPNAMIEQDSGYELLRYNEGQFYSEHTDSFLKQPRSVSCSIALNDNYEGGEFAFWGKKKKITLKKGNILMFPSNFMYPHEIMPVIKGTRYSIVTWFI